MQINLKLVCINFLKMKLSLKKKKIILGKGLTIVANVIQKEFLSNVEEYNLTIIVTIEHNNLLFEIYCSFLLKET